MKTNQIRVSFPGDGKPSKMSRFIRWRNRTYPDIPIDDPDLRKRFDEACRAEEKMKRNRRANMRPKK